MTYFSRYGYHIAKHYTDRDGTYPYRCVLLASHAADSLGDRLFLKPLHTQVTSYVLTLAGYILGHSHGGRAFPETVHGTFASILFIPLIAQFSIGVYLKLHIHEKSIRPYVVVAHGVLGKAWPVLGWTQMLFGALTLRGYWCVHCGFSLVFWCLAADIPNHSFGGALGQCLAHYIMGSAFIGYGILLSVALFAGSEWLRRVGHSQEWFDSWVIMLWGIVNTFT